MRRQILLTIFLVPVLSLANTLTLDQSIQIAKTNSPLITIAMQNIKLNKQTMNKELSIYHSHHQPKIDFNSEFQQNHQNSIKTDTLKNSINLSYNLSSYYINQTTLSSEALSSALKTQKKIVISSLIYDIKINYYKLASLKQKLKIMQKDKVILDKLKNITKKLVDKRVKLPSDILKIENRINMLNTDILIKQEDISLQKEKLINMIYGDKKSNINFESLNITFENDKNDNEIEKLLLNIKNSPQIKNLNYQLQSIKYQNKSINQDLYPTLYSSIDQQKDFQNSTNDQYNITIGINIPLFANDTSDYDKQIKKIKLYKQQLNIDKKIADIKNEIKQHIHKINLDKKLYKNYQNSISHQLKTFETLKLEYQAGLNSDISALISLQKDIVDMDMQKISVYFDYLKHMAKINYFLGEK